LQELRGMYHSGNPSIRGHVRVSWNHLSKEGAMGPVVEKIISKSPWEKGENVHNANGSCILHSSLLMGPKRSPGRNGMASKCQ